MTPPNCIDPIVWPAVNCFFRILLPDDCRGLLIVLLLPFTDNIFCTFYLQDYQMLKTYPVAILGFWIWDVVGAAPPVPMVCLISLSKMLLRIAL